jgi:hypothetical protein
MEKSQSKAALHRLVTDGRTLSRVFGLKRYPGVGCGAWNAIATRVLASLRSDHRVVHDAVVEIATTARRVDTTVGAGRPTLFRKAGRARFDEDTKSDQTGGGLR